MKRLSQQSKGDILKLLLSYKTLPFPFRRTVEHHLGKDTTLVLHKLIHECQLNTNKKSNEHVVTSTVFKKVPWKWIQSLLHIIHDNTIVAKQYSIDIHDLSRISYNTTQTNVHKWATLFFRIFTVKTDDDSLTISWNSTSHPHGTRHDVSSRHLHFFVTQMKLTPNVKQGTDHHGIDCLCHLFEQDTVTAKQYTEKEHTLVFNPSYYHTYWFSSCILILLSSELDDSVCVSPFSSQDSYDRFYRYMVTMMHLLSKKTTYDSDHLRMKETRIKKELKLDDI